MYDAQKPTEHDAWQACKAALNDCCGRVRGDKVPTPAFVPATTAPKPSVQPNASKLSLAKSPQEALTTTAGHLPRINSTKSGRAAAMHQNTKWPRM